MFDHNPNLDRWGNAMEFINGVAAGAVNPFLSAGEAVGLGDALYGTGYAIDKATMYGIAPLSADGKLSAIGGLGKLGGVEKDIGNAVRDWTAENPNAAETVEAAFNAAAFAKAAKLAKTGTGKAEVSDNFADGYKSKIDVNYSKISTGRTEARTLKEQLAMESVKSNPRGRTLPVKMNDSKNNLYAEDGWVKKAQNVNGVEIHYIENSKTGVKADFKFKD